MLQGRGSIADCFVTGEWKESENASALLAMDDDGMDSDELDGDFEDMETGEKHQGTAGAEPGAGSEQEEEEEDEEMPVHKGVYREMRFVEGHGMIWCDVNFGISVGPFCPV